MIIVNNDWNLDDFLLDSIVDNDYLVTISILELFCRFLFDLLRLNPDDWCTDSSDPLTMIQRIINNKLTDNNYWIYSNYYY